MFKFATNSLIDSCKKFRLLTLNNVAVRSITHFVDSGVYEYLDRLNYVGNRGIYWKHPESPFIMRITDDYDRCVKGNQSNDNTCWWYFSNPSLPIMTRNFNTQEVIYIRDVLKEWKMLKTLPENSHNGSTQNSRIYATFTNVPIEQKIFAVKQYISTFFTDDAIENLNSLASFSDAANEFAKNLTKIWSGAFDERTDMDRFRGHHIPDVYIDDAIHVLDIQTELGQLAENLLKPKVHELYKYNSKEYLKACVRERPLFNNHFPNKTFISEDEGKDIRIFTIGLHWILPTNMTNENNAIQLSPMNPALLLASWIIALENDVISYCKDKKAAFCPMSFCNEIIQSGKSEWEAARLIINRTNEAKKSIDIIWQNVPSDLTEHYEYLMRYTMAILDWNFMVGLQGTNNRYGWTPVLD